MNHNPPSTSTVNKLIAAWQANSPISFQELGDTDGPRGTKAGQHQFSAHSQQHTSKLILKSLLDNASARTGATDGHAVMALVRTHASIIAGRGLTLTGIPSDSRSTLTKRGVAHQRPTNDLASLWLATTTYRMHRARMAASTRGPRSPSRCGTATTW